MKRQTDIEPGPAAVIKETIPELAALLSCHVKHNGNCPQPTECIVGQHVMTALYHMVALCCFSLAYTVTYFYFIFSLLPYNLLWITMTKTTENLYIHHYL